MTPICTLKLLQEQNHLSAVTRVGEMGGRGGGEWRRKKLDNTVEPNKQTWLGFSFHPYIIYVALDKFPKPISAQPPHL